MVTISEYMAAVNKKRGPSQPPFSIQGYMMTCGVYEIVNTVNGKRYVGSSEWIERRWADHRRLLNASKHHSKHLQRAWIKHGSGSFLFNIIEVCGPEVILLVEQKHIDEGCHYNIAKVAGSRKGVKATDETRMKNRIAQELNWTEDARKAVSDKSRAMWADDEFMERSISYRNDDAYKSMMSQSSARLWSDPEYKRKQIDAFNTPQAILNRSISSRSDIVYNFTHEHHGDRNCRQYDLKSEFKDLLASGVSQMCSGKVKSHKGWTIKKAPN